jgi:hypothetical protein
MKRSPIDESDRIDATSMLMDASSSRKVFANQAALL